VAPAQPGATRPRRTAAEALAALEHQSPSRCADFETRDTAAFQSTPRFAALHAPDASLRLENVWIIRCEVVSAPAPVAPGEVPPESQSAHYVTGFCAFVSDDTLEVTWSGSQTNATDNANCAQGR
jgi:hypothetical protein